MAIVPNGNKKVMVAQTFANPNTDLNYGNANTNVPQKVEFPDGVDPKDLQMPKGTLTGGIGKEDKTDIPQTLQQQKSEEAKSLGEFLFDKLVEFGYPPRRLEQFENDFVDEKIFQGGTKEVTVILPDRYYATRKPLSDTDFSNIVKTIQEKFGLSFMEAQRKDKKITMSFTSQSTSQEGTEETVVGDVLDEVYGGGSGGSSPAKKEKPNKEKVKSSPKKAETMLEMLKSGKSNLIEALLKELK